MVQIIPANQRPRKRTFGEQLSEGVQKAIPMAQQYYEQHKENEALKARGIDVAGITDPTTRSQIISQELQQGRKQKTAEASIGAQEQDQGLYQKKEMPEFQTGIKKTPIDISEITDRRQYQGVIPQIGSTGQKVPVLDPNQASQIASQRAQFKTQSGVPTTFEQEYQQVQSENNQRIKHNQLVDEEKQNKAVAEEAYGAKGVENLKRVIENPSLEQEALFTRKGIEAAKSGEDQAGINKMLANEAVKYKNTIAAVKKSLGPERLGSPQSILGESRDAEKKILDMRLKLDPLLKEGQYDTARNLLSELGYGLEERESIVSSLPEGTMKSLAEFPVLQIKEPAHLKSGRFGPTAKTLEQRAKPNITDEQKQLVNTSVSDIVKKDPSTNLILLRSKFGPKNVDWQDFKDAINYSIMEGGFVLNDDQFKHLKYLDEPPLNALDNILHGMNLIGK